MQVLLVPIVQHLLYLLALPKLLHRVVIRDTLKAQLAN